MEFIFKKTIITKCKFINRATIIVHPYKEPLAIMHIDNNVLNDICIALSTLMMQPATEVENSNLMLFE